MCWKVYQSFAGAWESTHAIFICQLIRRRCQVLEAFQSWASSSTENLREYKWMESMVYRCKYKAGCPIFKYIYSYKKRGNKRRKLPLWPKCRPIRMKYKRSNTTSHASLPTQSLRSRVQSSTKTTSSKKIPLWCCAYVNSPTEGLNKTRSIYGRAPTSMRKTVQP